MSHLAISLLGSFRVTLDGNRVTQLRSDKARALLAYLAVRAHTHANAPCQREVLAGLLWPDQPDEGARHNLRQALNQLRNVIADRDASPPFLRVTRRTLQFNPESDYWLDVAAFSELVAASRAHRHRRPDACRACARRLREAVDLYRGDFLAGVSLDSALYEEWLVVQREGLHRQALDALHSLAVYHERRREYGLTIEYARRQIALEPWREDAHRQWMRALALSGQRVEALARYEACRRALLEELGIEPAEETAALYERILSLSKDALVEEDLSPLPPHNLPAASTPFVGRKAALAEIEERLQDPDCRLLSLVGPGGIGKTRLALEAARGEVGGYDHGVFFVPLAPVQSADLMVSIVAQALGFSFHGRGDPRQQLFSYLREKQVLLVMDNFEHLLARPEATRRARPAGLQSPVIPSALRSRRFCVYDGTRDPFLEARNAARSIASTRDDERSLSGDFATTLVSDILSAAPEVTILTTSRARLNVRSEHLFPVSGMDCPPLPAPAGEGSQSILAQHAEERGATEEGEYSAVALFLQSARRVLPGYEPGADVAHVGRICHLVGGMPLAILLAATWMDVLAPAAIADRIEREIDFLRADLRDVPDRHRSIRVVFDASWATLSDAERAAFAGLSVFRGGFTDDAAEAVAGAELRTLRALLQKSFLERSQSGRYGIHELLRQYGEGRLDAMPGEKDRVLDRHCAYYAEFLHRRREDISWRGERQDALHEVDNLRAAWRRTVLRSKVDEMLKSFPALDDLYMLQGWFQEGEAIFGWSAEVLRAGDVTGERAVVLAKVLMGQGFYLERLGHSGKQLAQEGLSLLHKFGDRRDLALGCLAVYHAGGLDSYAEAKQLFLESLAIYREMGDAEGMIEALVNLGMLAVSHGAHREAEPYCRELLELTSDREHFRYKALALELLGHIAYGQSEYAKARQFYEKSLDLFQEIGFGMMVGGVFSRVGMVAFAQGEYEEAKERYREALGRFRDADNPQKLAVPLAGLGDVALAMGNVQQARQYYRQALESGASGSDVGLKLDVLVSQATLLARVGEGASSPERAAELLALVLYRHSDAPVRHNQEMMNEARRLLDELQAELPPDVFAAAQERGRARDLDATVAELLTELQGKT